MAPLVQVLGGVTSVALIADIHANALALEAVLRACKERAVSAIWCAGDVVGYNAMPRETIALLRRRVAASVHGNHDLMVVGLLPASDIGPRARRAVEWTRETLSESEVRWLAALPPMLRFGSHVLCLHATLGDTRTRLASDVEWGA
ncbi:MAG TPA: metallophosphoesterase family protein, partial [Gemmatimonadaceae bacterium]